MLENGLVVKLSRRFILIKKEAQDIFLEPLLLGDFLHYHANPFALYSKLETLTSGAMNSCCLRSSFLSGFTSLKTDYKC